MIRRCVIVLLMACMGSMAQAQTGWWGVLSGALKAGRALTITDEQLAEVVKDGVKNMDRENTVCPTSSAYAKRLARLTRGMKDADGIALNFKVYRTKEVNAFACPDGSVRVFSALMDGLSDDELLGVIGHEIGHVALRHSKKAWKDALLRSAVSDALGAFSETWATLSYSVIGDICSAALSAKFSRQQEMMADQYGYDFLKKCGKDPKAMIKALKRLKTLSEGKGNSKYLKWLQAFSSHPDFDTRIEKLERIGP